MIHWDRAEKFIAMLGSHEQTVYQDRSDEIDHRRKKDRFDKRGGREEPQRTVTVSAEA